MGNVIKVSIVILTIVLGVYGNNDNKYNAPNYLACIKEFTSVDVAGEQKCVPVEASACDAWPVTSQDGESSLGRSQPILTTISIKSANKVLEKENKTIFIGILGLKWQINSDWLLSDLREVQVAAQGVAEGERTFSDGTIIRVKQNANISDLYSCNVFSMSNLNITVESRNVSIVGWSTEVAYDSSFVVTIRTHPENSSVSYVIDTPRFISNDSDNHRAENWQPVIGVALNMDQSQATLHAVVEIPPQTMNFTGYNLTLTDDRQYYDITFSNVSFVSRNVSRIHAYYKFQYVLFSPDCENFTCPTVTSPRIYLEDFPPATSVPVSTVTVTASATDSETTTLSTTPELLITTTLSSEEPPELVDNETKKKIILVSTLVSILGVALMVGVACGVYWWRKNGCHCCYDGFQRKRLENGLEMIVKSSPSVLILYSSDCDYHEQVVVEFASYLKHTFHCNVSVDLWEQNEIQSCGAVAWLLDKLETCHFVIIVCSAGARLKCVRGRSSLKPKDDRPVPDIFSTAVDYVAERMWMMRCDSRPLSNFLVVCFEYAGENDIPPKLDRIQRYLLPYDLCRLFCHIYNIQYNEALENSAVKQFLGKTAESLHCTDTGSQLLKSLYNAKEFFANNPNWMLEEIDKDMGKDIQAPVDVNLSLTNSPSLDQVVPPPSSMNGEFQYVGDRTGPPTSDTYSPESQSSRTSQIDPRNPPPVQFGLRKETSDTRSGKLSSSSVASEEDTLLEQRNRKRMVRDEQNLEHIPQVQVRTSGKKKSGSPKKKPSLSPTSSLHNGWSSVVRNSKKIVRQFQGYSNLIESHPYPAEQEWGVEKEDGKHSDIHSINGEDQPSETSPESGDTKISPGDVSEESDSLPDEEQLQRDVAFIQNPNALTIYNIDLSTSKEQNFPFKPLDSEFSQNSGISGEKNFSNHSYATEDNMCLTSLGNGDASSTEKLLTHPNFSGQYSSQVPFKTSHNGHCVSGSTWA